MRHMLVMHFCRLRRGSSVAIDRGDIGTITPSNNRILWQLRMLPSRVGHLLQCKQNGSSREKPFSECNLCAVYAVTIFSLVKIKPRFPTTAQLHRPPRLGILILVCCRTNKQTNNTHHSRHCRKVRNVCNLLIVSSSIHSIVHVSCHRVLPSCHEWIASLPACLGGLVHTRVFFIYVLNSDYYLLYFFVVECSLYFFCVSYGNI